MIGLHAEKGNPSPKLNLASSLRRNDPHQRCADCVKALIKIWVLSLVFAGHGYASKQAIPPMLPTSDMKTLVEPFGQIFPSLELALQTQRKANQTTGTVLGQADSLIGVALIAKRPRESIKVQISAEPYLLPSVLEVRLASEGQRYEIHPELRWDRTQLANIKKRRELALQLQVWRDGKWYRWTYKATLRATSEALFGVRYEQPAHNLDLNWIFAAYVDEQSPIVARVLEQARRSGVVERFDGYASQDPEQVYAQVFAVWNALQSQGIRYSNLNPRDSLDKRLFSQYVRFVEQSWGSQKANCVDGSVLLASVLMQIGIRPVLVVLPRHMVLGFYTDASQQEIKFLETTRLGDVLRDTKGRVSLQQSLSNFETALTDAQQQIDQAVLKFEEPNNFDYQLIDVAAARSAGIQPISAGAAGQNLPQSAR